MAANISPESMAFQKYKASLKGGICDVSDIATRLYSAGVISRTTEEEATHNAHTPGDRCSILLNAVEKNILYCNEKSFDVFMDILSREPVYKEIVWKARVERGESVAVYSLVFHYAIYWHWVFLE